MIYTPKEIDFFNEMYGRDAFTFVQFVINELAPITRRDEWWGTDGPYEIIGRSLKTWKERD